MKTRATYLSKGLGFVLALFSLAWLGTTAARADPPATIANCAGIKDAYPILGTQCTTAYAKISHAPADADERLASFNARVAVLTLFRKALLCNGIFGASSQVQQRFKSGEQGHLAQLVQLRINMAANQDPNIPAAFTQQDLNQTSIRKQQCK